MRFNKLAGPAIQFDFRAINLEWNHTGNLTGVKGGKMGFRYLVVARVE